MMTLDQWKAQQAKKEGPTFNLRKAGEGSDLDPKWKKTYAYKKDVLTQEDEEDEVSTAYNIWIVGHRTLNWIPLLGPNEVMKIRGVRSSNVVGIICQHLLKI